MILFSVIGKERVRIEEGGKEMRMRMISEKDTEMKMVKIKEEDIKMRTEMTGGGGKEKAMVTIDTGGIGMKRMKIESEGIEKMRYVILTLLLRDLVHIWHLGVLGNQQITYQNHTKIF